MKKVRIKFLTWIVKTARNHRRARNAAQGLLFLEALNVSWYNPLWHLRNSSVLWKKLTATIRREMRGYQTPVAFPNPNVLICKNFLCVKHTEHGCTTANFTPRCYEQCFGIRWNDGGTVEPAWTDYNGNPDWIPLGCRDCTHYLGTCKGIEPGAMNPIRRSAVKNAALKS
jgi:hypothetical protein